MRSQRKLSSPYHCIMFFMSFWDAVVSVAQALTTLPMPSDVHDVYPFAGQALGNKVTCNIQGVLILGGQAFAISSTLALSVFYVCTIRYGMMEDIVKKRLLPFLLVLSCILSFPVAIVPLSLSLVNPRPYETYCYLGSYPVNCQKTKEYECINGNPSEASEDIVKLVYLCTLGSIFFVIMISLVLVVMSVLTTEKQMRYSLQLGRSEEVPRCNSEEVTGDNEDPNSQIPSRSNDELKLTRGALRLALMYIAAFLLTWIWPIVSILFGSFITSESLWNFIDYSKLIFNPLLGFFNGKFNYSVTWHRN